MAHEDTVARERVCSAAKGIGRSSLMRCFLPSPSRQHPQVKLIELDNPRGWVHFQLGNLVEGEDEDWTDPEA